MVIAIGQLIENSNDSEEIKGVEEDFSFIKQVLEKISQSQDASFPNEGIREMLDIYNFYTQILAENTLLKKHNDLEEFERVLEIFKEKYKEFFPGEILGGWRHIKTWIEVNIALLNGKTHFLRAFQQEDGKKQLDMTYAGCIDILDIAEKYLSFFTVRGRKLIKSVAETLINYRPFGDYASLQPPGEFTARAIEIRNAARSILWEIDRYEKQIPESVSIDWEEEEAFMDMLIKDMEEARKAEYSQEDAEALEKALEKFIE